MREYAVKRGRKEINRGKSRPGRGKKQGTSGRFKKRVICRREPKAAERGFRYQSLEHAGYSAKKGPTRSQSTRATNNYY